MELNISNLNLSSVFKCHLKSLGLNPPSTFGELNEILKSKDMKFDMCQTKDVNGNDEYEIILYKHDKNMSTHRFVSNDTNFVKDIISRILLEDIIKNS